MTIPDKEKRNEYMRNWYKVGGGWTTTRALKQRQKREAKYIIIDTYKRYLGCYVCGDNAAKLIDLHHLDATEKEFSISVMICMSWKSLLKEMSKCIVLCRKCHRKVSTEKFSLLLNDYNEKGCSSCLLKMSEITFDRRSLGGTKGKTWAGKGRCK